jgi:hypothetical protein
MVIYRGLPVDFKTKSTSRIVANENKKIFELSAELQKKFHDISHLFLFQNKSIRIIIFS